MAGVPLLSSNGDRARDSQLHLEAQVRRLLRRANNPFLLAANPLAQALCEATDIADPQHALRAAVEGAFQGCAYDRRLGDMLLRAIEGRTPEAQVEEWQLSRRHLQRRRAKAVAILTSHIRRVIGGPSTVAIEDGSGHADPLEKMAELIANIEPGTAALIFRVANPRSASNAGALAARQRVDLGAELQNGADFERYVGHSLVEVLRAQSDAIGGRDGEIRSVFTHPAARAERGSTNSAEMSFELEWLAFLRARYRSDARQMDRIARNLKRLAADRSLWVSRALSAQAEATIRCGRLEEAAALLNSADRQSLRSLALREMGCTNGLRAELALQRGDDASAERFAMGAYLLLQGRHHVAYRCQTTIARARLRLREPWSPPPDVGILRESAWDRVALNIELARHSFADGNVERCGSLAREALAIASSQGYNGLSARAAATIGATIDQPPERRLWYRRALSLVLPTHDRSVSNDLFVLEKGRGLEPFLCSSQVISNLLYDALLTSIPHLRSPSLHEQNAGRLFVNQLIESIFASDRHSERFDDAIRTLDKRAPSFAQYFLHFLADVSEVLETFVAAIDDSERSRAEYRLHGALHKAVTSIEPRDNARHFLVG